MTATLTLDKAGRVVLPKWMRDKLRLKEGSKLKAEVRGDGIFVEEEESDKVKVVMGKDGRRVIIGMESFDAVQAIREMRDERMEQLLKPFAK